MSAKAESSRTSWTLEPFAPLMLVTLFFQQYILAKPNNVFTSNFNFVMDYLVQKQNLDPKVTSGLNSSSVFSKTLSG